MEQLKLTKNEYNDLSFFVRPMEDYGELSINFLHFSDPNTEPEYDFLSKIVSEKFLGNWSELLKFVQEYSSVKTTAKVYGTYSVSGYAEQEIASSDPDELEGLDWDVSDEYDLDDLCDVDFQTEGKPEIESNVETIPFSDYEESLSTPEKKGA